MNDEWQTLPPESWQWRGGALRDGAPVERDLQASYALCPSVPAHLNGRVQVTLEVPDWRSSGCAGVVFRAGDLWSMNCAYIYAPKENGKRVLLRFAVYSDGRWDPIVDSRDEIPLVESLAHFSLEYRSGLISCEVTSGSDRIAMSHVITCNPFPGRVGVLRFYNCHVTVKTFHADWQESLPAVSCAKLRQAAIDIPLTAPVSQVFAPVSAYREPQGPPITILFLAANPPDQQSVKLTTEFEGIRQRLDGTKHHDVYKVEAHFDVKATNLQSLLFRYRPQIVHFSGHGTHDGQLVFQDPSVGSTPMPVELIAKVFENVSQFVRCVVLNACFSRKQASAIVKSVDIVVGMDGAIQDTDAITFSARFYETLGTGEDALTAFKAACNEIEIAQQASVSRELTAPRDVSSNEPERGGVTAQQPQLLQREGVQANQVRFVNP